MGGRPRCLGPGIPGAGGQEKLVRRPGGHLNIQHVSLTLGAVQQITDLGDAACEENESHTEAKFAKGPVVVVQPYKKLVQRLKSPQAALVWAAHEGIPPVELQKPQELVLEDV